MEVIYIFIGLTITVLLIILTIYLIIKINEISKSLNNSIDKFDSFIDKLNQIEQDILNFIQKQ
jgi:predicted PurR-regulated permease PerM